MSTTLTEKPAETDSGRRLLRGMPWLVVRQHRVALLCVLGLTLVASLLIAYGRNELVQLLDAKVAGEGRRSPDGEQPRLRVRRFPPRRPP